MATVTSFQRASGTATTAGTTIFTVPQNTTLVLVGVRLTNKTTDYHTAHVVINGTYVTGLNTPIPSGSSLEANPSKMIVEAGDEIVVYADEDDSVDVWLSFLEELTVEV